MAFSPYYARARRRGAADPLEHVGFNIALYGPRTKRWALTERRQRNLSRGANYLAIGPSNLSWSGKGVDAEINETGAPLPLSIRGRIRLQPETASPLTLRLDPEGRHRWTPLIPCGRIKVEFQHPAIDWQGTAYLDSNAGDGPLERDLASWHWSRSHDRSGTSIFYDVTTRSGSNMCHAIRYDRSGEYSFIPIPQQRELGRTELWRLPRATRLSSDSLKGRVATLEDTPFYARSLLHGARDETTIQESLSLDRFRWPIVQLMLPFRMRRMLS
jgi:carotenoid 1,2-hydratase